MFVRITCDIHIVKITCGNHIIKISVYAKFVPKAPPLPNKTIFNDFFPSFPCFADDPSLENIKKKRRRRERELIGCLGKIKFTSNDI